MGIKLGREQEIDAGIVLDESGVGIYGGSVDPNTLSEGDDVQVGSQYYQSNGSGWIKETAGAGGWEEVHRVGTPYGLDHNNLVTAEVSVLTGAYSEIESAPANGEDVSPLNSTHTFIVEAEKVNPAGDMDVRLYNEDTATELAVLNFTEATKTVKRITFTFTGGEQILSVQAKRSTSNGVVYAAILLTEW